MKLRDSGSRVKYSTGALKEDIGVGKGRYDLLPPTAIRRIAEIYRKGAIKYTRWKKVSAEQAIEEIIANCTCRLGNGVSCKDFLCIDNQEDQHKTSQKRLCDLLSQEGVCTPTRQFKFAEEHFWRFYDGARNWEKGLPLSRLLDSAKRHLDQYHEGLQDEDHLAQAAWNILGLLHTEEMIRRGILPKELDDLPSYMPIDADPKLWRPRK